MTAGHRASLLALLLPCGAATSLAAQADHLEAVAIAQAASAEHDWETAGQLSVCVGVVRPGTSDVGDPMPQALQLAEDLLDRRPAPWAPGDSTAVANLTAASRCARMQDRREMLAEASGREPTPVRYIVLEVTGLEPGGGWEISVRYRGDAEGELRCSSRHSSDGPRFGCTGSGANPVP